MQLCVFLIYRRFNYIWLCFEGFLGPPCGSGLHKVSHVYKAVFVVWLCAGQKQPTVTEQGTGPALQLSCPR